MEIITLNSHDFRKENSSFAIIWLDLLGRGVFRAARVKPYTYLRRTISHVQHLKFPFSIFTWNILVLVQDFNDMYWSNFKIAFPKTYISGSHARIRLISI